MGLEAGQFPMFGHIGLLEPSSVLGDERFEWLYLEFFDLYSDGSSVPLSLNMSTADLACGMRLCSLRCRMLWSDESKDRGLLYCSWLF